MVEIWFVSEPTQVYCVSSLICRESNVHWLPKYTQEDDQNIKTKKEIVNKFNPKRATEERQMLELATYLMDISHEVWQEKQGLSHIICKESKANKPWWCCCLSCKQDISHWQNLKQWNQSAHIIKSGFLTSTVRGSFCVVWKLRGEILDGTSNTHVLQAMCIMTVPYYPKLKLTWHN